MNAVSIIFFSDIRFFFLVLFTRATQDGWLLNEVVVRAHKKGANGAYREDM